MEVKQFLGLTINMQGMMKGAGLLAPSDWGEDAARPGAQGQLRLLLQGEENDGGET